MPGVLNSASEINRVMLARWLGSAAETEWIALRRELNELASVYYLPGLHT